MRIRFTSLTVIVLCLLCRQIALGDLQERSALAKSDTISRPNYAHELIVKFRDAAQVRSDGNVLSSLTTADVDTVTGVAQEYEATFRQLITLPDEEIVFLEQRAAAASGIAQPDLAGIMRVDAPDERLQDLAQALNELDIVEIVAFRQVLPPPPCDDIAPATPTYNAHQDYHGPDPGLNMDAAWALGDTRGAGIKIADCEYGYNDRHEDLCDVVMEDGQTIHPDVIEFSWDEHGTAVLGEMISLDNDYGCYGMVPEAAGYFFTEWSVEEDFRRTAAIAHAIATVNPGDIVVLEMQTTGDGGGYGPAELDFDVWMLSKNATDAGIIVVGAAGNGNQNLDSGSYATYRSWGDSGALIVGAGSPDTGHDKLSYSTYGSRVNVQGWGYEVFTLGYGSYAEHGGDKNQRYTAGFSGTSSATPLVASASTALQSFAEAQLGRRLLPLELRQILIDTGIPQGSGGHIGPLPDVYAAALSFAASCPADIDGSGAVDFGDILAILSAWGPCAECPEDLDDSGAVDFADILMVLAGWGPCP